MLLPKKIDKLMKYSFTILVLILFPIFCFAQKIQMPEIEAETSYIGAYKVSIGYSPSTPLQDMIRVLGYDFEIKMRIIYKTNTPFEDTFFGIVCVMQDGTSLKLLIDPNNVSSFSSREYEYKFPFRIKSEGWVQVYLTRRSDFLLDDDPRLYKNTSKRLSLYLTPQ